MTPNVSRSEYEETCHGLIWANNTTREDVVPAAGSGGELAMCSSSTAGASPVSEVFEATWRRMSRHEVNGSSQGKFRSI